MNSMPSDNPYAPVPYTDLSDHVVGRALQGPEGRIIEILDSNGVPGMPIFFFAATQAPHDFYRLYDIESGFDGWNESYAFITHHPLLEVCLYFLGNPNLADIIYSENTPELNDGDDTKIIIRWDTLPETEGKEIEHGIHTGMIRLLSFPSDHRVDFAFTLPDNHPHIPGTILITHEVYKSHSYAAQFLQAASDKTPAEIAFYKGDKRLSPNDIRECLYSRHIKSPEKLSVSLNGGDKMITDFAGAAFLEEEEIQALVEAGRVRDVPVTPTPLVTPLLYKVTP